MRLLHNEQLADAIGSNFQFVPTRSFDDLSSVDYINLGWRRRVCFNKVQTMHTCPPPTDALTEWLEAYGTVEQSYGHLLLEQKTEIDQELIDALRPYFESAHLDAREYFHAQVGISLHPDAAGGPPPVCYPNCLPSKAHRGLFGEVVAGLECLTEPLDLVEADEGAAERGEGEVDVGAALVAHREAAEAGEPGQGALHHPPVPAQALAALDPASGDAGRDAPRTALPAAAAVVVGLVGVQLARPAPRTAPRARPDRRDRVECRGEHAAVVSVGPAQGHAKGRAPGVGDQVPLGAGLASVGRARAGLRAPLFAGTLALSSAARRQSICPAPCSRSSSARCSAAQTPATCQSRNRRQQLIPEPQPISAGRSSHGMPVLSTKTIPVSAARSGIGGRPPFGFGRGGGSRGATAAQRSSGTRGRAMPAPTRQIRFR